MKKAVAVFLFLFCAGCASTIKQSVELPQGKRQFLFPYGTYQHQVNVKIKSVNNHGPKEFNFQGIFNFQKDHLKMVGLSPMGTTLFKIDENLKDHQIQMEIYIDQLKGKEDKIKPFFIATKEILTYQIKDQTLPQKLSLKADGKPMEISILDYDKLNIPKTIQADTADFNLNIEVLSYEF
jgi:hypothetical protein